MQNSIKTGLERWSTIDGMGFRFSVANSLFDLEGKVVGKFHSVSPFFVFSQSGLPQKTGNCVHFEVLVVSVRVRPFLFLLPTGQKAARPLDEGLIKASLAWFSLLGF